MRGSFSLQPVNQSASHTTHKPISLVCIIKKVVCWFCLDKGKIFERITQTLLPIKRKAFQQIAPCPPSCLPNASPIWQQARCHKRKYFHGIRTPAFLLLARAILHALHLYKKQASKPFAPGFLYISSITHSPSYSYLKMSELLWKQGSHTCFHLRSFGCECRERCVKDVSFTTTGWTTAGYSCVKAWSRVEVSFLCRVGNRLK